MLEVESHVAADRVRCFALTPTRGLARGTPVIDTGGGLEVPVGQALLGRMLNLSGEPVDSGPAPACEARLPMHRPPLPLERRIATREVFVTGIKAIDLLAPLDRGGKAGLFGGAGVGKTVMVLGQMNEPPGARFRVGDAALSIAEHFRDAEHLDVLLLIDNIFRYVQSGMKVSGLLGRIPSRVGYQPTLATELAEFEERIASTASAGMTSVQAVYVPADDLTDPSATHTFGHLWASLVLSRKRAAQGLYPAVDPLASDSKMLTPGVVGERHFRIAHEVRRVLAEYEELKNIIAMLGMEELSTQDRETVSQARRLERFLTQPFFTTGHFTGRPGAQVTLVKCGAEVLVSAVHAVEHHDLSALQGMVAETYLALDDEERRARTALARLEAGAVRRLVELERQVHG